MWRRYVTVALRAMMHKLTRNNRHRGHSVTTTLSTNVLCTTKKFLWESLDSVVNLLHLSPRTRICLIPSLPLRTFKPSPCLEACGLGERLCHPRPLSRNTLQWINFLYLMLINQLPAAEVVTKRDRMCPISWSPRLP